MSLIFWQRRQAPKRPHWLAGGLGFEPRFSESESDVLPLNYPPLKGRSCYSIWDGFCKSQEGIETTAIFSEWPRRAGKFSTDSRTRSGQNRGKLIQLQI